jgi:uncharacterized BrkB/YihY/UPF0761 family membrane protein
MRNVLDKSCRENQNTHFVFNNFFPQNGAFYETRFKNVVQLDRPQMAIWRMGFACWMTKATNTNSEYVINIAFSHPQWLHEYASMLNYT